ncbi:ERMES complex subunit mmm1 [Thecaphora frezii]
MDASFPAAGVASGAGGAASYPPPAYYNYPLPPASPLPVSRWTFTQGLIVGQISMVVIALFLIRYVIFEDSATALEKERLMRLKISERRSKRHAKALLDHAKRLGTTSKLALHHRGTGRDLDDDDAAEKGGTKATLAEILDKIGYDITSHGSESCDWLNIVLAQAVAGYREDVLAGGVAPQPASPPQPPAGNGSTMASGMNFSTLFGSSSPATPDASDAPAPAREKERTARDLMEEILNRSTSKANSFLDPIRVTEADFGEAYPIFTNARVRPADDTGRMRIEVDVDYSDQITLAIDTKLLINFPRPRFAVLPISLSLTIVRFSGTLAVELFSSDPNATVLPSSSGGGNNGYAGLASSASSPRNARPPLPAPPLKPVETPRSRHRLHFSLHPDFALEASASSLLGSRAKLQDIPKIEQLLISRLRGWILDRFVWPRYWSLTLPNLVPGPMANAAAEATTTAGEGEGDAEAAGQMTLETGVDPRLAPAPAGHRDGSAPTASGSAASAAAATAAGGGASGARDLNVEAWRTQTLLEAEAAARPKLVHGVGLSSRAGQTVKRRDIARSTTSSVVDSSFAL